LKKKLKERKIRAEIIKNESEENDKYTKKGRRLKTRWKGKKEKNRGKCGKTVKT